MGGRALPSGSTVAAPLVASGEVHLSEILAESLLKLDDPVEVLGEARPVEHEEMVQPVERLMVAAEARHLSGEVAHFLEVGCVQLVSALVWQAGAPPDDQLLREPHERVRARHCREEAGRPATLERLAPAQARHAQLVASAQPGGSQHR